MHLKGLPPQRRKLLFTSSPSSSHDLAQSHLRSSKQFLSVTSSHKRKTTGICLERKVRISMDNLYRQNESLAKNNGESNQQSTNSIFKRVCSPQSDKFSTHYCSPLEGSKLSSGQMTRLHQPLREQVFRQEEIVKTYYTQQQSTKSSSRVSKLVGQGLSRGKYDLRGLVRF